MTFTKQIVFFGSMSTLSCDGKCNKAWGGSARPKKFFTSREVDPDDYVYLPDSKLPAAPIPNTYECDQGRPSAVGITNPEQMNKWCARECERSILVPYGRPIVLPDLEHPLPNKHSRHPKPPVTLK